MVETSIPPIGIPGWPELAFCTASIERARIALTRFYLYLSKLSFVDLDLFINIDIYMNSITEKKKII